MRSRIFSFLSPFHSHPLGSPDSQLYYLNSTFIATYGQGLIGLFQLQFLVSKTERKQCISSLLTNLHQSVSTHRHKTNIELQETFSHFLFHQIFAAVGVGWKFRPGKQSVGPGTPGSQRARSTPVQGVLFRLLQCRRHEAHFVLRGTILPPKQW